jgi:hypothetical protein
MRAGRWAWACLFGAGSDNRSAAVDRASMDANARAGETWKPYEALPPDSGARRVRRAVDGCRRPVRSARRDHPGPAHGSNHHSIRPGARHREGVRGAAAAASRFHRAGSRGGLLTGARRAVATCGFLEVGLVGEVDLEEGRDGKRDGDGQLCLSRQAVEQTMEAACDAMAQMGKGLNAGGHDRLLKGRTANCGGDQTGRLRSTHPKRRNACGALAEWRPASRSVASGVEICSAFGMTGRDTSRAHPSESPRRFPRETGRRR